MIQEVMRSVNPVLQRELGMLKIPVSGLVNIDVSPNFDIKMHTDMSGAFYNNNGVSAENGTVTRTNGAQLDADFSNSLHSNNNAVGNGSVSRTNGYAEETSLDTIKAGLEAASTLGQAVTTPSQQATMAQQTVMAPYTIIQQPLPQMQPIQKMPQLQPRGLGQMLPGGYLEQANVQPMAKPSEEGTPPVSTEATVGRGGGSLITIKVTPTFKIDVTTNMSKAFHDNNGAKVINGDVKRVNGANVNANFSGALHDNNNAISSGTDQNGVKRVNGFAKSA